MARTESVQRKLKVIRVVTAAYVVPWHLANTLKRLPQDFEVTVVGQGVSVYRDRYPGIRWIDLDLERRAAWFADLKALFALCRIFRTIQPDIVHSIMPKAGLLTAIAGFLCRVPVRMHTFTGQVWATRHGLARDFYYAVDRLINTLNSVCLTDSPSQSAFLYEHGFSHVGKALPVLSKGSLSGVDLQKFRADAQVGEKIRCELHIPSDAVVFLFLGRMNRDKGLLDLAHAFAAVNDARAHLLLAGPDEEDIAAKVRGIARACADRVHCVGFADRPEDYMAAADLFCLPSYREGFGSVVIEAAALGVPAIGTHIPGLLDAIADGYSGVLIRPGDREGLVCIMREALHQPEKYREMGANARNRVEQVFSAEVLYDALKHFYLDRFAKRKAKRAGGD
ncbi:MAG: glycosyltransferase [Gammaproteobacteria bacterium]|nr:glycosyltransferase [Gammaproteobacteria bacterium]MBU1776234.1 glycosyltransferase [Gammaproteobacteria bacterium]